MAELELFVTPDKKARNRPALGHTQLPWVFWSTRHSAKVACLDGMPNTVGFVCAHLYGAGPPGRMAETVEPRALDHENTILESK